MTSPRSAGSTNPRTVGGLLPAKCLDLPWDDRAVEGVLSPRQRGYEHEGGREGDGQACGEPQRILAPRCGLSAAQRWFAEVHRAVRHERRTFVHHVQELGAERARAILQPPNARWFRLAFAAFDLHVAEVPEPVGIGDVGGDVRVGVDRDRASRWLGNRTRKRRPARSAEQQEQADTHARKPTTGASSEREQRSCQRAAHGESSPARAVTASSSSPLSRSGSWRTQPPRRHP